MSGRQSAEVTRALQLVKRGMTPYRAAKTVGIALRTIYRAQKRHRDAAAQQVPKATGQQVCEAANDDIVARMMKRFGPTNTPGKP